jgi:hypothetical protein
MGTLANYFYAVRLERSMISDKFAQLARYKRIYRDRCGRQFDRQWRDGGPRKPYDSAADKCRDSGWAWRVPAA